MIGERVGRYEILEEVGQGGMSVVYRGRDTVLDRPVAVKVLHPHLANRPDSRRRFEREARAIAKLSHPNIVQVFDFSETDSERAYIVMEFIEGSTLREFLDEHPMRFPEIAAMIGIQICLALQHAHQLGIIHRDIKPENVMIGRDGSVKLTDFGIAQIVDAQAMTVTGTLLGSPAHMSPEMIEGNPMDFRADLFSLGTVLYFAATGELPFSGKNAPLVLKAILEGNYLDAEMANPSVGRRFSRIVDKLLARDPTARHDSVDDLIEDLEEFLELAGLNVDLTEELAAFFDAPEPYQEHLEARLVESLEAAGLDALREGRVAFALEHFNRVLALQPGHENVLRHIRRIDRRRKTMFYSGAAVVVLVVVGVVAAVAALADDEGKNGGESDAGFDATIITADPRGEEEADVEGAYRANELAVTAQRRCDLVAELRSRRRVISVANVRLARACTVADDEANSRVRVPIRDAGTNEDVRGDRDGTLAANEADVAGETEPDVPPPDIVSVKMPVFPFTTEVVINNKLYSAARIANGIEVDREGRDFITYLARCPVCKTRRGRINLVPHAQTSFAAPLLKMSYADARIIVRVQPNDDRAAVTISDFSTRRALANGWPGKALRIPIEGDAAERRVNVTVVPSKSSTGTGYTQLTDIKVTSNATRTLTVSLKR